MKVKSTQPDYVTCTRCNGDGAIELTGVFAETLVLLRKQKKEVGTTVLADAAKVKIPAMNNRLAWLESHGLATSRKFGQQRLWTAS